MASDFQQINDYNFNIDSFVQGNNGAVLRFNVRRKGAIVPIDNATVNVAIKRGQELITKNATIISAPSGICEVILTRADLATAGTYYLQPTIIFPDDDEFSGDVQKFTVSGKLTGTPTNPGNGGTNPVFTVRDSAINGNIIINGAETVVYDDTGKVDKVTGKGLSTNDYDNIEKAEVAKVKDKADKTYVDTSLADKANKKNMPFIDVTIFGTDLASFQTAINYCVTNSYKLYIPRGSYTWNGEVVASGFISILGDSAQINNGCLTTPYGIEISGVTFNGGYVSNGITEFTGVQHYTQQINFSPSSSDIRVSIKRCTFQNNLRSIVGSVLTTNFSNYFLSQVDISENIFKSIQRLPVAVYLNGDITVSHNSFYSCGANDGNNYTLIQIGDTSNTAQNIRPDKATIKDNEFYRTLGKPNTVQGSLSLQQRQISVTAENAFIQGNVFTDDNTLSSWLSISSIYAKMKKGVISHNTINTWNNIYDAILVKGSGDVSTSYEEIRIHDNIITGTYGKGITTYRNCHIYNNYIKLTMGVRGISHFGDTVADQNRIISIHDNTAILTPVTLSVTSNPAFDEEIYNENDVHAFLIWHNQDKLYFYSNNLILDETNGLQVGGLKFANNQGSPTNSPLCRIYNNNFNILNNTSTVVSGLSLYYTNDVYVENNLFQGNWYYAISVFSSITNSIRISKNTILAFISRFISGSTLISLPIANITNNDIIGSSHCISGLKCGELNFERNIVSLADGFKNVLFGNAATNQKAINNHVKLGTLISESASNIACLSVGNVMDNTGFAYNVSGTSSSVKSYNNVILAQSNVYVATSFTTLQDIGLKTS